MKQQITKILWVFIIMLIMIKVQAQSDVSGIGGHTRVNGYFVGWDGTGTNNSGTLEIRNDFTQPINFFTGGTQRMTILGNNTLTNGYVGIGYNFTPDNKLDVDSGDIDVNQATRCYIIGDSAVLHYRGLEGYTSPSISNIFVGVGAGNSNTTGDSNVFVGYQAGYNNAIEHDNTFIGCRAGFNTFSGPGNTFVGSNAGYSNTTGVGNVFMGVRAGYSNISYSYPEGSYNTFVGNLAGEYNTTGKFNCFYGKHAGWGNDTGDGNVYIGDHCGTNSVSHKHNTFIGLASGENNTGDFNTMCGASSGHDNTGHKNIICGQAAGFYNSGDSNIIIGPYAGTSNTGDFNLIFGEITGFNNTGDTNVMIGDAAGYSNTGNSNCFLGTYSGYGNTGDLNTYIGHRSHMGTTNFYNTTAIGANTEVTHDNTMILGDNNVNVGIGLSGDALWPQNRLEINFSEATDEYDPNTGGGTGFSGLRFRDLTANSDPWHPNPGKGVLALDENGDVIYVPDSIGSFGAACGSNPPYNLTDDWRVGLVDENNNHTPYTLYFEGQHVGNKSNVAVGYNCDNSLLAKLNVVQRKTLSFLSTELGNYSFAGAFLSAPDVNCIVSEGVVGWSSGNTLYGIGVAGVADVTDPNNNAAIGVYGESIPHGPNISTNPHWAGWFNGSVYAAGDFLPSDSTIKKSVKSISNSLRGVL